MNDIIKALLDSALLHEGAFAEALQAFAEACYKAGYRQGVKDCGQEATEAKR